VWRIVASSGSATSSELLNSNRGFRIRNPINVTKMSGRLENDAFLRRLDEMYRETRESGSVSVSMKMARADRFGKGPQALREDLSEARQACLVRAIVTGGLIAKGKNRKKKGVGKVSTLVFGEGQEAFLAELAELMKASMDNMKVQRDKKKKKQRLLQERRRKRQTQQTTATT